MSLIGKAVLGLETPPWDSLYRAVIGFYMMPAYYRLGGAGEPVWKLVAFFLVVLVLLRIVPGLMRRVLPFSREIKSVWAERRALARRYDSYQWRKLFGLGLGWLTFLFASGNTWATARILAGFCLIAGSLGMVFWHRHSKALSSQPGSAASAAPTSA
jgi:hypothetical protein